jgi:hypothetical protein
MVMRFMRLYHGRIKMTRSIPTFGKYDQTEKYGDFSRFRYTSSKDGKFAYAFLLIWPKNTTEITLGAPLSSSRTVVTLLGSSGDLLPWHAASGARGMVIDVSSIKVHLLQGDWTWAFKLENLLSDDNSTTTPGLTTSGLTTPAQGTPVSFHSSMLFFTLLCLLYILA